MPRPATLRCGIARPLPVRIETDSSGLDMNTVTAVVLRVHGAQSEWPTVLSERTASGLTATHLVTAAECPGAGQYKVTPILTVEGQSWPEIAEDIQLMVTP